MYHWWQYRRQSLRYTIIGFADCMQGGIEMKVTEIFEAKKKTGKPVLSFEIFPPKKEEALKNIDATLEKLCDLHPDFISVTFGAGAAQ